MNENGRVHSSWIARQRGVTLIELFVVIGLIAVLATIATPYFKDMVGRYRLNSAARDVSNLIRLARVLAVTRNSQVRVLFTEVDTNLSDSGSTAGVVRLEQYSPPGTPGAWQVVDSLQTPPDNSCMVNTPGVGTHPVEYCVDLKAEYPNTVSIAHVDAVGVGGESRPNLVYGADGFILNPVDDFKLGSNQQTIEIVLINKRYDGLFEGRIISIDRAGGVQILPYRGSGAP